MRALLLGSVALLSAGAAFAQTAEPVAAAEETFGGDIIITATKRSQALSDVPIAVSAISAESLQNSGATDIRQLNQLSPSLLVSSTSSESSGGVARIRGIGTVGDNAGLESSVAVFIDGVYRSRTGAGLTELGELERIEVLRGPQGTLFGRNASAGLINIVTAKPKFEIGGNAELSYGNFNYWRVAGGVTGPLIEDKLAARIDGVYTKRDGFIEDVISGDKVNNRDRYLIRGQMLFTPNEDVEIRLIGDYARRTEACCASAFLPFNLVVRDAQGNPQFRPSPIAATVRALGGVITDDTFARQTSITPGRDYEGKGTDWGFSGEVNWDIGDVKLTSITAYRDWKAVRNQDADYTNLDILEITDNSTQFRTFTQELRLNGELFDGRLDWLVGAFYADEKLDFTGTTKYGQDYMRFANAIVRLSVPTFPGYEVIAAAVGQPGNTLNGRGIEGDDFRQDSRNYAFFTHNTFDIIEDKLTLTLGGRYTNERKRLNVSLNGNNTLCAAIATSPSASIRALAALPCVINPIDIFTGESEKKEDQFTYTAVLSFKPTDNLMTYASYSKGYKAGGFNLDRSALSFVSVNLDALKFEPELVDAMEIGAKLDLERVNLNVAAFRSVFNQFQLNTFNGTNFIVENIVSCRDDLAAGMGDPNAPDRDFAGLPVNGVPLTQAQAAASGSCGADRTRGGVTSQGVEVEAGIFPVPNLAFNIGFTYAETKYRERLVGIGGRPFPTPLFNLPGRNVSNAPEFVQTGSVAWTPELGNGMGALFYVDYRLQSEILTGSDLFPEKRQGDFVVVNARIGLNGADRKWSIEAWAQNLLNEEYQQVGFNSPLLGSGTSAQTVRGGPNATTLFGSFLAEPRTFGVTVRTRF
jgi:iron complex outermembrane recepter protein